MNAAQIHLALNHAPLFLSICGGLILITGMLKNNSAYKTLSLYLLVAAALFTIPVYLTGEGTEELVENATGVTESAIEQHEEMAGISMIIIQITGVLALAGLFFRKKEAIARMLLIGTLLLSFASFGTMAQTAHLGGLIRHTELNSGQSAGGDAGEKGKEEENEKKENNQTNQPAVNETDSTRKAEQKKDDDD